LSALDDLQRAIRAACSAQAWSRGVELARAGAVVGEEDDGDEIALRVATRAGTVAPQVVLFPGDEDWTCDCNAAGDACAHVAAAVIALRQARAQGQTLPGNGPEATEAPGRVGYRFDGRSGKLTLRRVVVDAGGERALDGSIVKQTHVVTKPADLHFEKALGQTAGGIISAKAMLEVLSLLREADDVQLDGLPCEIGPATSGLAARVTEHAGGFLVRLEQDREIDEVYQNGAFRKGRTLMAVANHGLSESDFSTFRRGKIYAADEVGTLVGVVLPRLRRRVSVVIEAATLPGAKTIKPQIQLATRRVDDGLEVLPTIVYGAPPVARVDGEKLTMLRAGRDAEKGSQVPIRNVGLERVLATRLRELGLSPGTKLMLRPSDAMALAASLRGEDDVRLVGQAHREFFPAGDLVPRLEVDDGGGFSVWFEPAEGGEQDRSASGRVDAGAVLRAWERGDDYAPLLEGGFGRVPADWLARHGHRVAGLLAAREAARAEDDRQGAAPTWALPDLQALCVALEQPPPPGFDRLRALVEDFEGLPDPDLPGDLRGELRVYQRQGVAWLTFLRRAGLGGLLADDMGLGKTLQTLCAIEGRSLVVCPTSVLPNWATEIERFRPGLKVAVYHGPGRRLDPEADVTLTTYAILRLDVDTLADVRWETAVLDEAQAIKNPDSQVARAAYQLQAEFRVALTGTPVENSLEDLWSQMHFLNRGLLGGRSDFGEHYVKPISSAEQQAAERLRERIRPFVLRRLKSEVARELPPRTDLVLHCELDADERRVYDAVRAATQEQVVARLGGGADVMAMLEALLRLRQAACHPALVPGQSEARARPSAKVSLLVETLAETTAEGHKALVFSQWTTLLDLVEPHLKDEGLAFTRLDGSTRDRGSVVEGFQDPAGPPIMLISLRAGGTGLNLTAADHVFLLDPWWNPAVEDQAADRAHRIGQDNPVFVHRIVARDTVEERILALQQRKRKLADAALADATEATRITRDELLALLD
jgi:superfamily II DNA or RNA helicase